MLPVKYHIEQIDPPRSPRETLPTMYDLPSEDPEETGLPDEFHLWQADLLSYTFCPPNYATEQVFVGSDLNLYYDPQHTGWYKRPDWFAVVGVSRLYAGQDLRLSYVFWQEGVRPAVVVELLSPSTRNEDLGQSHRKAASEKPGEESSVHEKPPTKWEVYEQVLGIPYYILFDRYNNDELQAFQLEGGRYRKIALSEPKVWIPTLELNLALWQGEFRGKERQWLRWYDAAGNLVLTEAEQERQRANQTEALLVQEQQRAARLAERLRQMGVDPDAEGLI